MPAPEAQETQQHARTSAFRFILKNGDSGKYISDTAHTVDEAWAELTKRFGIDLRHVEKTTG